LLKVKLLDKINRNDLYWFNKFLIIFVIIYFIIVLFLLNNIIYLDTNINIKLNDLNITINGDYIDKIFTHFGAVTTFVIRYRLAAAFVTKHPMSLSGKIGTTIGAGSSAAFQLVNLTTGTIIGKILAQQGLNDGSLTLHIKDVVINDGNNLNSIENIVSSDPTSLIPKFQFSIEDRLSRFNSLNNKLNIIDVNNKPESKIIQRIEKQNNCSLNERKKKLNIYYNRMTTVFY